MSYQFLITLHSVFRWVVLISLVYAIVVAAKGLTTNEKFSAFHNSVRHWTATISHIQLVIGFILYFKSPVIKFFFSNMKASFDYTDTWFFASVHIILMLAAVVLITVGSALAKRKLTDPEKFKTMLTWFSLALLLIFIAIPWPFSPLANRPLTRSF